MKSTQMDLMAVVVFTLFATAAGLRRDCRARARRPRALVGIVLPGIGPDLSHVSP